MENPLTLRIVLENPTPGVNYGLQEGKGSGYKTIQIKRSDGENFEFECSISVNFRENKAPVFLGPFAQGPAEDRFIYIDIGTLAGQKNSCWNRRLKIYLRGIESGIIQQALLDTIPKFETVVYGSGKDGSPACGTAKPFMG